MIITVVRFDDHTFSQIPTLLKSTRSTKTRTTLTKWWKSTPIKIEWNKVRHTDVVSFCSRSSPFLRKSITRVIRLTFFIFILFYPLWNNNKFKEKSDVLNIIDWFYNKKKKNFHKINNVRTFLMPEPIKTFRNPLSTYEIS